MVKCEGRPLIGITAWYDYEKGDTYIKNGYIEAINQAGGMGILIPPVENEEIILGIFEKCRGILLSGGDDIDARYFGESNLPCNGEISPYRDRMEILFSRKAIECNKPILGICRGMQVMNVAMGGSIYQDIFSQLKYKDLVKHMQEAPKWYPVHRVSIDENSRLYRCMGKSSLEVNSFHHQAVKDLGDGFQATGRAEDGIIEAIEHSRNMFAIGVQWHPERMWEKSVECFKLFAGLVAAAS